MKKKLLITAIGAAFAAGPMLAAHADMKVYGAANVEISQQTLKIDSDGDGIDETDISGRVVQDLARGRIGIDASEDLGGGLSGIARFEWRVNTDNGGLGASQRESYVGLKGGFGTFMAGNLKTPYKYYGGVSYDAFVTTSLEARGNGGMSGKPGTDLLPANPTRIDDCMGHNGFCANMVGYKTPNWGGFEGWIDYGLDQGGNDDDVTGDQTANTGDYSIGVKYGMKGNVSWEVIAAANKDADRDDTNPNKQEYTASKVGAMVKFGRGVTHTVMAQLEAATTDESAPGNNDDYTAAVQYLAYNIGVGKFTGVVQFAANAVDYNAVDDQVGTYLAVGGIWQFSPQTRAYAGYRNTKADDTTGTSGAEYNQTAITIGLRKDF